MSFVKEVSPGLKDREWEPTEGALEGPPEACPLEDWWRPFAE
jgi:hypothetical protein